MPLFFRKLRFGLLATCAIPASIAHADQLPASAFQTYNAADASSIEAGTFALYSVPVNQILPAQLSAGYAEVGNAAAPQVSFDLQLPSGGDILLGYEGLISSRIQDHTVEARLNWAL